MRMTATGVVRCFAIPDGPNLIFALQIMAQLGMLVPAAEARYAKSLLFLVYAHPYYRLCPVDAILTRMGAYDNMFSNASTFKVELDEWYVRLSNIYHHLRDVSCKILRDATPKSLVILDGRSICTRTA
jgi:DNA mismatch repair protein MSH6